DAFHPGEHVWGWGADCAQGGYGYVYWMGPETVDLRGREKMRFGVRCDAGGGCATGGMRTWQNVADVAVTVRDDSPPAIEPTGGELLGEGWHRGFEMAWAHYRDNVGVRVVHGQIDRADNFAVHDFAQDGWPDWVRCHFTRPRPCADMSAGVGIDTASLSDGTHSLRLVAYDAAGNPAIWERPIRVDNHAPLAPRGVAVAGGGDWRRSNAFDVAWTDPPGQTAPIARVHWRLCRADGTGCRTGTSAPPRLDGVAVPEAGDWRLAVWLGDAAGNQSESKAAEPVPLRLDDVAPESPGFDVPDAADPRRVALTAADRHSGLAEVRVELRPRGGEWRALPVTVDDAGRATARVPDGELPDGGYDLRGILRDRAGNERVVEEDRAGRAMTLVLPLRTATRLTVTGPCELARRGAACRRRPEPARVPSRLRFGVPSTLAGHIETAGGRPVPGAQIEVSERTRTAPEWRRLASATAGPAGAFALRVPPGPSRTLRLAYAGTDLLLPATTERSVLVPAASTLTANRRRARNGQRVVFSGRLVGRPLPPGGRTVDLQAHYRGAWRTFATPRTDARGRWRHPYRFGATRGRVVYRFRALVKREAVYPYEQGASRTVRVVVTG
ncbi:MAG TPA: hypothetical protein VNB64_03905, partial [Solirubrobacteraceae bacterium]|nr:hypothetical protein [Solirubrobacteraceae bacterium]